MRLLNKQVFNSFVMSVGSGGGGGASGAVDYPAYQKQIQCDWLAGGNYDDIGSLSNLNPGNDVTSLLNSVIGNSPFTTAAAYDPSTRVTDMESVVDGILAQVETHVDNFNTDLNGLFSILSMSMDTYNGDQSLDDLEDYIDSLSTLDQVEQEISQFNVGMDNIGAVGSSAWVIGRGIIAAGLIDTKLRAKVELAKLKDGKAKAIGMTSEDRSVKLAQLTLDAKKTALMVLVEAINKVSGLDIEVQRLAIIAFKEQVEKDIKIEKQDALWDLTAFAMGANVMASIAGGTVSTPLDTPSDAQSAIAGGLSGAAAGAMLAPAGFGSSVVGGAMAGGPAGAMLGFVLGAGASFL